MRNLVWLIWFLIICICGCDAGGQQQHPPSDPLSNPAIVAEAGTDGYPVFRNGTVVKHKITGDRAVIIRHPRKDDEHIIDVCTGKFGGVRISDVWSETEVTPDQ